MWFCFAEFYNPTLFIILHIQCHCLSMLEGVWTIMSPVSPAVRLNLSVEVKLQVSCLRWSYLPVKQFIHVLWFMCSIRSANTYSWNAKTLSGHKASPVAAIVNSVFCCDLSPLRDQTVDNNHVPILLSSLVIEKRNLEILANISFKQLPTLFLPRWRLLLTRGTTCVTCIIQLRHSLCKIRSCIAVMDRPP